MFGPDMLTKAVSLIVSSLENPDIVKFVSIIDLWGDVTVLVNFCERLCSSRRVNCGTLRDKRLGFAYFEALIPSRKKRCKDLTLQEKKKVEMPRQNDDCAQLTVE